MRPPGPALVWLGAAAAAAAVRIATPFDHGIWLVAYLLLVGFLAQALLVAGQDRLYRRARSSPTHGRLRVETTLWNLGVAAVPVGVLVDARIAVALGSCALLAALAVFARSLEASPGPQAEIPTATAYTALLLGMAFSVAIGMFLAWDIPWI